MIFLTQLEIKLLFDDYTYNDYYDATEADTLIDFVYEEDSDDN